jgi:hypothetical protein
MSTCTAHAYGSHSARTATPGRWLVPALALGMQVRLVDAHTGAPAVKQRLHCSGRRWRSRGLRAHYMAAGAGGSCSRLALRERDLAAE